MKLINIIRGNQTEYFRYRKGYFLWNVLVICNYTLKMQDIVVRWPHSSHNQTISNNFCVRMKFESEIFGNKLLLGEGGYGITKYLITPLTQPNSAVERLFNEPRICFRHRIERYFSVWKHRFPILSPDIRVN